MYFNITKTEKGDMRDSSLSTLNLSKMGDPKMSAKSLNYNQKSIQKRIPTEKEIRMDGLKSLLNYGNKLSVIQQNRLFETNLIKDNMDTIQKRPQPNESSNKSW